MSQSRLTICVALVALPALSAAEPIPRTDLLGDPLPTGAVARIGSVRFLPRPYLEQVFFASDGATVIGRGGDNVVQFWDAETGKPTGELRDPDMVNFRVDQSPDGKLLALFGQDKRGKPMPDTALRVYDLATRKPIWTQVMDDVYCYHWAVRYTLDGRHILTGTNADLRVWDAKTGVLIAKQKGTISYSGLVLSPDGTLVVGGEQLWVWDWAAGGSPRNIILKPNRQHFNYLAFAPDGKTIYVQDASRDAADAYDVASGNFIGTADPSAAQWRSVSPDGKTVASAHYDKDKRAASVVLRDATSGTEVGRLSSGSFTIRDARWSKDGSRLVGAGTYRAWVWDVKTGKALGPTIPGHAGQVLNLAFTSDGRLIAASDDGTVRAWDPATGQAERTRILSGNVFWRFAVSGDGSLMAAMPPNQPNEVRLWDSKTGAGYRLAWSTSRTGGVYGIQFTADDQTLLTYGSDFHVRAWDLVTGKLRVERKVRPASLGPEDDEGDRQLSGLGFYNPRQVDLGSDGNTLVLGLNKDIVVYSIDSGRERFKVEADEQRVETVLLSADAKRLATTGVGPPPPKGAAAPAGRQIQVTVWDLAQAKQLCRFQAPGSSFFPVMMFTPDAKRLVTGSQDDRLRFWDATTGAALGAIELPRSPMRVAFSHDGKLVAVSFYDPTILVYDVAAALKP